MSNPYVHLYFYSNKQLNKLLIEEIVKSCVDIGLKYNNKYWVRGTVNSTTNKPISDAIKEIIKSEGSIDFYYDALDALSGEKEVTVGIFKNDINKEIIVMVLTTSIFLFNYDYKEDINEKKRAALNAELLLELVKSLYQVIQPIYGYWDWDAHIPWMWNYLEDPDIPRQLENLELDRIYWVNFFSPNLVKKIGREKLLSAPSYKTEELKDGGILLMAGSEPFDFLVNGIDREEVEKHLGIQRDLDLAHVKRNEYEPKK